MGDVEEGTPGTKPSHVNERDPDEIIRIKSVPNEPDFRSPAPGVWQSSISREHCCIYRVPNRLRRVNPEAYTPQMLLLGPLHHSRKAEAAALSTINSLSEDLVKINLRYMDYLNMERQKRKYLEDFSKRAGTDTVEQFRKMILKDENIIRASYAESTEWIESPEFVDMILHDSVFILEFLLRAYKKGNSTRKTEDILMNEPWLQNTIWEDLILLENQLPYFILEKMFEPIVKKLQPEETFRDLVLKCFRLEGKIKETTKFRHFLDLIRRARVETLNVTKEQRDKIRGSIVKHLYIADKLDSAGVKFKAVEEELSLEVKFEKGCLKMPSFSADDNVEMILRNMMALEQCHFPFTSFVCNYIMFLDFLIDTDKDVDLLVETGVIKNWMGHEGSVTEMVNKLCLGVVEVSSHYYHIAECLNAHYRNPLNRSRAKLRRVYFTDLWKGTATVAATVLLLLTLIQTVASVIQVLQNEDNNAPPKPPPLFFP